MSTLGKRIKELRQEKGLSQDDLARDIGVSKGTVSVWERDVRKPEFDTLDLLCEYFQVNLGYLLGEDVDRALSRPDEEKLAMYEKEDRHQVIVGFVRRFIRLSPEMQGIVKKTLLAAFEFDLNRGALQVIDEEEIADIADKIAEGKYWKAISDM